MDEEDELDLSMYETKESKLTQRKRQERDRERAISAHQKWKKTIENCILCYDSASFKKHLMISLGEYSYIALVPPFMAITDFHIRIVPLKHKWSSTELDEEEWSEMVRFRKSLEAMFHSIDKGVIFMETVMGKPDVRHTCIEVIPVERHVEEDVPLVFKKEIMQCDNEWQAANRKCIDTSKKGIRRSVPPNFPYFHVEWSNLTGPPGGYCHVIDDQNIFKSSFGRETLLPLIGEHVGRKSKELQRKRHPEFERQAMISTLKLWKKFDWTVELDG